MAREVAVLRVVLRVEAVVGHARRVAVGERIGRAVRVVDADGGVGQRRGHHVPVDLVGDAREVGRVHAVRARRVVERDAHVGLDGVGVDKRHVLVDVELGLRGAVVARHLLVVGVHPDGLVGSLVAGEQHVDVVVVQVGIVLARRHGVGLGHPQHRVVVVDGLQCVARLPRTAPLRVGRRSSAVPVHPVVQHMHHLPVGVAGGGDVVVGGIHLRVAVLVEIGQLGLAVGADARLHAGRAVGGYIGVFTRIAVPQRAAVVVAGKVAEIVCRRCRAAQAGVAVLNPAPVDSHKAACVLRRAFVVELRVGEAVQQVAFQVTAHQATHLVAVERGDADGRVYRGRTVVIARAAYQAAHDGRRMVGHYLARHLAVLYRARVGVAHQTAHHQAVLVLKRVFRTLYEQVFDGAALQQADDLLDVGVVLLQYARWSSLSRLVIPVMVCPLPFSTPWNPGLFT